VIKRSIAVVNCVMRWGINYVIWFVSSTHCTVLQEFPDNIHEHTGSKIGVFSMKHIAMVACSLIQALFQMFVFFVFL